MNICRIVSCLLCLILSLSTGTVAAQTDPPIPRLGYGKGRELAKLADPAVNESSGLAAGRTNPGVFWTHNDSGSRPQVFAFTMQGKALATITVTGAQARDWEDMASFTHHGRGVLLAADVGDNNANRGLYTLYAFYEPRHEPTDVPPPVEEMPAAQTATAEPADEPAKPDAQPVDGDDPKLRMLREQLELCRAMDDSQMIAYTVGQIALFIEEHGDPGAALAYRAEEVEIQRRSNRPRALSIALALMADLLSGGLNRHADALPLAEESYDLAADNGLTDLTETVKSLIESIRQKAANP